MKLTLEIEKTQFEINSQGHDISIPLIFNGPQPNTYGVPIAKSQAFEGGGFVGDTRRGGGCNFEVYSFTPHCNGTHTECIGHIAEERISIREKLRDALHPATLLSIEPVSAIDSTDAYAPAYGEEDKIIDADSIRKGVQGIPAKFLQALVIRTLPNDDSKTARDYMKQTPAFFSIDAMRLLNELGVQHLLIDLPSVDRLFDEGILSAHHEFWSVPHGTNKVDPASASTKTITEMVYVPNSVPDGNYLLNLQIAPFQSDAAPSRPVLYSLTEI